MANKFKFIRVDSFFDDINREDCFDTRDMDGVTPNYRFVLASACKQNINDNLDEDGTLNENVELIETDGSDDGLCALLWSQGVNGERNCSINDSTVTFDLGEDAQDIKAIFLVNIADGSGYVLAYCIFDKPVRENGILILPCNGSLVSLRYGN